MIRELTLPAKSPPLVRDPEVGSRSRKLLRRALSVTPIVPVTVYLVVAFLVPVLLLIAGSFSQDGTYPTLAQYRRLIDAPVYWKTLLSTLRSALITTAIVVAAAYPVAYLLANCRRSLRARLIVLVLLPFWTSFVIRCFAWIVLLGRQGAINKLLLSLGLVDHPLALVFNSTGAFIGMTHAMMPLCIVTMLSVMDGIDTNLARAAGTLGAPPSQAFWRIYFPLSMPGVSAGALLVFIISIGFFITPALLGGAQDTMIAQLIIFQIQSVLDWSFAGAIVMLLLVSIVAIFLVYNGVFGLSSMPLNVRGGGATASGGSTFFPRLGYAILFIVARACETAGRLASMLRPARADRPRRDLGRIALWVAGGAVMAFLSLPALFVVPVSFTSDGYLAWPPRGFSLRWYQEVFASDAWWRAAALSFATALSTAVLATLIATPAAFALVRDRFPGKGVVLVLLLMPMMVPSIITAVALYYLYARIGLVGTPAGLVLGHTILAIPYVVVTMSAVLKGYDIRLDQAAAILGANRLASLRYVTLPLLKSGLFAAFVFAFAISFDELTVSLFVTGGELRTLPRALWDSALLSVTPELTAVASLMLLVVVVIVLAPELIRRRSPV